MLRLGSSAVGGRGDRRESTLTQIRPSLLYTGPDEITELHDKLKMKKKDLVSI